MATLFLNLLALNTAESVKENSFFSLKLLAVIVYVVDNFLSQLILFSN